MDAMSGSCFDSSVAFSRTILNSFAWISNKNTVHRVPSTLNIDCFKL